MISYAKSPLEKYLKRAFPYLCAVTTQPKKRLLVLAGPTASGKTDLAIKLSQQHGGAPILSADSRQIYREMRIGTARPTDQQIAAAPHHFIATRSIFDPPFTAGDFVKQALDILETHYAEHDTAILCGGTGMYIRALCEGIDTFPDVTTEIKQAVKLLYQNEGIAALQAAVAAEDPQYFAETDTQNPHRLIRALEVTRAAGQPFSTYRSGQKAIRPFEPTYMLLHPDRQILLQRIEKRVHNMMSEGLLDEARELYPHRNLIPLQTVGYQEFFQYFDGNYTLNQAIERLIIHTRQYAKRQITWFKKDNFWQYI